MELIVYQTSSLNKTLIDDTRRPVPLTREENRSLCTIFTDKVITGVTACLPWSPAETGCLACSCMPMISKASSIGALISTITTIPGI